MDADENNTRLPLVQTRKQFMDYLEDAITPPRDGDEDPRGRPRELKAYILESERGIPSSFGSNGMEGTVQSTGLDGIKILRLQQGRDGFEFFLDTNDPRFFVLHTNERSEDVSRMIRALTRDHHYAFDSTWFHSRMLYGFAKKAGNKFNGFGVRYDSDTFQSSEDNHSGIEDLGITANGSLAHRMLDIIGGEPAINKTIAFNKVRIRRGQGSASDSIQDDVAYNGYFSVKRGRSVQDHLHLIDICRDEYSKTIKRVEDYRIGIKTIDDRTLAAGKSFDFRFENNIEDLDLFIDRLFNSTEPFRLWGLKTKVHEGYFKVTAVDLHASALINFDISDNLMRAYLYKGNCGNTILRLFTNLQIHYDSRITCEQIIQE